MEARYVTIFLAGLALSNVAASYSSRNFVVTAPTAEMAEQIAQRAEECRVETARWWLGYELKPWFRPCVVNVQVGQMGSGGVTTFSFDRGTVGDWNMNVQGSFERIMDSVIPHEVSHTIFACHFLRPLPRWADEGAATIIEHPVERDRQKQLVRQILGTSQRIPLRELLEIKEYPTEMQKVLNLYAEGYTLCEWLVFHWGQKNYLAFLNAAHQEGWDQAIAAHYPYKTVEELEQGWLIWIKEGMQSPEKDPETLLVQADQSVGKNQKEETEGNGTEGEVRGQAPDDRRVVSTPEEQPALRQVTKTPPARRRAVEAPPVSSSPKAPTTGDVDLGEEGDILAAVEALPSRRSMSARGMRRELEDSPRDTDRSVTNRNQESFEERDEDARRSSPLREGSGLRDRVAAGHQRSPDVSRDEDDSVEVGDNSLRPEPRPAARLREVTPDTETLDRKTVTGQRSTSRGAGGSPTANPGQRYRRGRANSKVTDWNAPVASAPKRRPRKSQPQEEHDYRLADQE